MLPLQENPFLMILQKIKKRIELKKDDIYIYEYIHIYIITIERLLI